MKNRLLNPFGGTLSPGEQILNYREKNYKIWQTFNHLLLTLCYSADYYDPGKKFII